MRARTRMTGGGSRGRRSFEPNLCSDVVHSLWDNTSHRCLPAADDRTLELVEFSSEARVVEQASRKREHARTTLHLGVGQRRGEGGQSCG